MFKYTMWGCLSKGCADVYEHDVAVYKYRRERCLITECRGVLIQDIGMFNYRMQGCINAGCWQDVETTGGVLLKRG